MPDPFNLQRFLDAQAPVYDQALAELRAGRKESHWMWFIFPQLRGLGRSATAERFALAGGGEALAYLAHPVLGSRLQACCLALLSLDKKDPAHVLGSVDALKLRSCMTLFAAISDDDLFHRVLRKYFDGEADSLTVSILEREADIDDRL